MAYVVAEPCIGAKDGNCAAVCPLDCIHPTKEEAAFAREVMVYINPETCIDCGLCMDECGAGAVFPREDLPERWQFFVKRNADYFARGDRPAGAFLRAFR